MTHRGAFMHHHYKKGVFGMAKKGWGKFVAFAAVTGAVAAGVSYVLQYKTYHRELEKDFREFEDGGEDRTDEDGTDRTIDTRSLDRNYISLSSSKDEFKVAAKDMAQATKNVLKDAGSLLSDTAHEAVSAAVDTAQIALQTVKTKKADFMDEHSRDKDDDSICLKMRAFWTTTMWTRTTSMITAAWTAVPPMIQEILRKMITMTAARSLRNRKQAALPLSLRKIRWNNTAV